MAAARGTSTDIVRLLLEHGAETEACGLWEWTALHWAACLGRSGHVDALIEHGADLASPSGTGATALHHAAGQGHCGVARSLLNACSALLGLEDEDRETPLAWAARGRRPRMIRLLIESGACANRRNAHGWTPLHLSAARGDLALSELLLGVGAHPLIPDLFDVTPLSLAQEASHGPVVDLLERAASQGWRASRPADFAVGAHSHWKL
jgi:ankyrin repeat protein